MRYRRKLEMLLWIGIAVLGIGSLSGCLKKRTIATVNNQAITRDAFMDQLEARYGMQTLHWLIVKNLVTAEIQKLGITITEADIQEGMAEWKMNMAQTEGANLESPQAFADYLALRGMTEKDVREDVRLNLEVDRLATKDVKIADAETKQYFDTNHSEFDRPATVTLAQIICKDRATADRVVKKLDEGATFGEMASQFSVDERSKGNGGLVGEVALSQLGPLSSSVKALDVGEISNPIRVPGEGASGYIIFKVISKRAAEPGNYDKLKQRIERGLKRRKGKKQDQVIDDLLKNANIDVKVPRYLKLKEVLGQRGGKAPSPTQPAPPAMGKAKGG